MAAGPGGREGYFQVERSGVGHDDRLRPPLQGGAKVRLYGVARQLFIRQGGPPRAEEQQVFFAQRQEIPEVAAADRAQSGYQEPHCWINITARRPWQRHTNSSVLAVLVSRPGKKYNHFRDG